MKTRSRSSPGPAVNSSLPTTTTTGPEACVVQGVLSVLGSGLLASGCDDPHAPFENDSLG